MLRVCTLAGEALATFSADEVDGKSVHQLKKSLAKQIGATRFQQRWLTADHTELHDDAVAPCCDVQLVVVDFVQAEECEMEQLISACRENRPDELVDFLRKPLNPRGATALYEAAENGHSEVVRLLLEAGAKIEPSPLGRLFMQRTALHVAAAKGHFDVVRLLLEEGAEKDAGDSEWRRTALHVAAQNGHSNVVKLLLMAGVDKDVANEYAYTALHLAAREGHSEVV